VATGEVLPLPKGSSMRLRSRTDAAVRGRKKPPGRPSAGSSDGQVGPGEHLLASQCALLRTRRDVLELISETVICDMLTERSTRRRATVAIVTVASRYPADTDMPK